MIVLFIIQTRTCSFKPLDKSEKQVFSSINEQGEIDATPFIFQDKHWILDISKEHYSRAPFTFCLPYIIYENDALKMIIKENSNIDTVTEFFWLNSDNEFKIDLFKIYDTEICNKIHNKQIKGLKNIISTLSKKFEQSESDIKNLKQIELKFINFDNKNLKPLDLFKMRKFLYNFDFFMKIIENQKNSEIQNIFVEQPKKNYLKNYEKTVILIRKNVSAYCDSVHHFENRLHHKGILTLIYNWFVNIFSLTKSEKVDSFNYCDPMNISFVNGILDRLKKEEGDESYRTIHLIDILTRNYSEEFLERRKYFSMISKTNPNFFLLELFKNQKRGAEPEIINLNADFQNILFKMSSDENAEKFSDHSNFWIRFKKNQLEDINIIRTSVLGESKTSKKSYENDFIKQVQIEIENLNNILIKYEDDLNDIIDVLMQSLFEKLSKEAVQYLSNTIMNQKLKLIDENGNVDKWKFHHILLEMGTIGTDEAPGDQTTSIQFKLFNWDNTLLI